MNGLGQNLGWLVPESGSDDLSNHLHRQLVGYVGVALPIVLWLMAFLRPIEALKEYQYPWELLNSISAYYYTAAVSALSGGLIALSLFLFAYRGYDNDYRLCDRVAAIVAACAALLVAFFPGQAPIDELRPSWWTCLIGGIHYSAAVVLFCSFAFFSLFQFPRALSGNVKLFQSRSEKWDRGKWARNWIYYACGGVIVACLIWAAIGSITGASIFWPETLALEFFALSWLVKGRTDKTLGRVWRVVRGKPVKGRAAP